MKKYPELIFLGIDGGMPQYVLDGVREGKFPGFARALREGAFLTDCRPPFPTISPTCITTLATGTTPEVHGATCNDYHVPGTELDEGITLYNGKNILAESFWQSAARIGKKSLLIGMPGTDLKEPNPLIKSDYSQQENPPHLPTVPVGRGIPLQCYRLIPGKNAEKWISVIPETPSGPWEPSYTLNPLDVQPDEDGIFTLPTVDFRHRFDCCNLQDYNWYARLGEGCLRVAAEAEALNDDGCMKMTIGEWSPVIRRKLSNGGRLYDYRFRMKLFKDGESLVLFITSSAELTRRITPPDFAEHVDKLPYMSSNNNYSVFMYDMDGLKTCFELQQMNYDWHLAVIEDTMENDPVDIIVSFLGEPDSFNHNFRSAFEGLVPGQEYAQKIYEGAYEVVDRYLQQLYERVIGPDTILVIASDHGSVGYTDVIKPHDVLEKAGMLAYNPDGTPDWSKTRAWPFGTCHVYVNLKGRDPHGIVDPEDYEKTVHEIIRVLQEGFRDPETGLCTLAFAVPNDQAGFVGQGGERSGDVVYGIIGSTYGGYFGGVHACQISTARTKTGDIRSLCVFSGPAFKQDVILNRPANTCDIAPTLCYACGYPQPAQATGAVIFQALQQS